jgi:secreted trypsin-like serine protease
MRRTASIALRIGLWTLVGATGFAACGERREGVSVAPVVGVEAHIDTTHDVVVAVKTEGGSLCSGTVVGRSATGNAYVLTAAHCCRSANAPNKITVGADYSDPAATYKVSSYQRHPCYNPLSNDYDFCVVEVDDAGALKSRAIPLAAAPDEVVPGTEVTVVGYGSTPATNTLRRVAEAKILDVTPFTIAADQREGRGGICFGDSGGPMLVSTPQGEVVAGVVSFGAPTSLCNIVGVAGRVSFAGVRAEFLDKVLSGKESKLKSVLLRRSGLSHGTVGDTYIASDQPDANFGDAVELLVGSPPGTNGVRRALLRFDLSSVPADVNVLTARMGFHEETKTGAGTISVHRITQDWDSRRVTWTSFGEGGFERTPVASEGNATAITEATESVWFDVTPLAQEWIAGNASNFGVMLVQDTEQTQLLSSEIGRGTERPWMQICYLPAK